ncbi:unannotated protein [freshwater metagenome]|uniref:Unannotated protein n=1 Tax=freshwater metagenome TaxID=449393 RepID=A0A6J7LQM2_9ZZZZ
MDPAKVEPSRRPRRGCEHALHREGIEFVDATGEQARVRDHLVRLIAELVHDTVAHVLDGEVRPEPQGEDHVSGTLREFAEPRIVRPHRIRRLVRHRPSQS